LAKISDGNWIDISTVFMSSALRERDMVLSRIVSALKI
jgi:hypothetical protein